jgi:hypothetical protein
MAPALQEVIRCSGALVGCSLLFGLLMQPLETAGPDGVGKQGPNLKFRLLRLGHSRVVPVSGLTGFAITSLRSHNFMEPVDRPELDFASDSMSSSVTQ